MALFLSPIESTALEWTAQPHITAGASVNDNVNLETAPHDTVWNTTLSPQLTLSVNSQRTSMNGRAQLNRLDYSDSSALSRTNGLLDLTLSRLYERAQLSLTGNLTRDSTLESELMDTGFVTTQAQRTSRSLSPSVAYSITELNVVSLGYNYVDVSYGNTATTSGLLDYTVTDPTITLSHAFSEKNKLTLSLDYSDYESQNPATLTTARYHSTTTSAQVGFTRDFSETLTVSLMAGVHSTDSIVTYQECLFHLGICFPNPILTETDSSETGSLFRASLQKAFESSQLTAELSRSLQPTADGGLVQTDRISGSYDERLTQTLSGSLRLAFYKTQSGAVSSNSQDSRYYSIAPAISWRITERWSADTSYYRSVSQNANGTEATGNAINLTLNYNWPKISMSR